MRVMFAVFLFLLLPLSAMAQDNPIIARMAAFKEAYNAADAQALAQIYAPDAILLPQGLKAVIGREAIAAFYEAGFERGLRDLQVKTFDIRPLGKTAAQEVGETVVRSGDQRIVGRYMHLWEVLDGELLLTRDMYHVLVVD